MFTSVRSQEIRVLVLADFLYNPELLRHFELVEVWLYTLMGQVCGKLHVYQDTLTLQDLNSQFFLLCVENLVFLGILSACFCLL